jgi:hypothetical protein
MTTAPRPLKVDHHATSPPILPQELLYSILDTFSSCWDWHLFLESDARCILAAPGLRWYLDLRLVNRMAKLFF